MPSKKSSTAIADTKSKMIKEGNLLEEQANILSGTTPVDIKSSKQKKGNSKANTPVAPKQADFDNFLRTAEKRFSSLTPDKDDANSFGGEVKITRLLKTNNK